LKAKKIFSLLDTYDIDTIENSLIYLFLTKIEKINTKNNLIQNRIKSQNHEAINFINEFLSKNKIELNLKNMERIFELLIESDERKMAGAFYTPEYIVGYIIDRVIEKTPDILLCDCSCGSGAFLVSSSEKISQINEKSIISTIENNIYGVDINPRSVERTKIILTLLALQNNEDNESIKFNIKIGDSLNPLKFNWNKEFPNVFEKGGFDAVVGNPPYVRIQNLDKETRKIIQKKWYTAKSGSIDLYIAFFELGMKKLLNEKGKLGYITPNSYFTSAAGKNLRILMKADKKIKEIIDFDYIQVFEDVMVYTCITILDNKRNDSFNYIKISNYEELENLNKLNFSKVGYNRLNEEKWILSDDIEYRIITKIENAGKKLGRISRISTGLATLADKLYILENPYEKEGYMIHRYKDKQYYIEKGITKKILKASIICDETEIPKHNRYIIFPYEISGKSARIIPEKRLKEEFPNAYQYLLDVKNDLDKRDKGKTNSVAWYAYGRSQGLESSFGEKILTSGMNLRPRFFICDDPEYTFYSGYAIYYDGDKEVLKKILNSIIMHYYIKNTSKSYSGGYMAYSKTFLDNFSIPDLTIEEKIYIKSENDKKKLDEFLINKYFGNDSDIIEVLQNYS